MSLSGDKIDINCGAYDMRINNELIHGMTSLHVSAAIDAVETVDRCVQLGADLNARTAATKRLIELKADVEAVDHYNRRPIEVPRCECKYESRNTSTIRFVVIFIIGIISFLVVYMAFLSLLDPLIHKHAVATRNYEQHVDEEVSMDEQVVSDTDGITRRRATTPVISPTTSGGPPPKNMLNRVGQQQTKWKKQVIEQRKNIYDKHTMLN
ncbi:unnamed protein product [Medioppia subpectinata]|uniref:Uncharacterized protein n=1 Tax=Medioppia subpectinata TaxID=1979941 RepID=A0A7R9KLL9_9ACAR|nr:unnamed protein product [Medioppia subpectinata]CAG2105870.1 unnamed protein product [Medioppia subpectinata]